MAVSTKVLSTKKFFKHLHPDTLGELAKTALVVDYKKGERIFNIGDCDDKEIFLIYGAVRLESTDNHSVIINQNDPKAELALSTIKPRQYTATAEAYNTCVLFIHDKILEHLNRKNKQHYSDGIYSEIIPDRRVKQR